MTLLKKFCCCCGLESGGIIYGWLGLVKDILTSVVIIIAFTQIDNVSIQTDKRIQITFIIGIALTLSLINLIIGILLIVGILKRKALMVLPWLVTNMIAIVIFFFGSIGGLSQSTEKSIVPEVLVMLIGLALSVYIWICVLSVYQHLRDVSIAPMTNQSNVVRFEENRVNTPKEDGLPPYHKIYNA